MENNSCRTRFAPSPTGELHIGGARTALFNWLWARRNNGEFFLRFEDTDRVRSSELSKQHILEDLKWLGITWTDPVVSQSERLDRYSEIKRLLEQSGHIYPCFCSVSKTHSEETCHCLELNDRERRQKTADQNPCWRLSIDSKATTHFHDRIRGDIAISNDNFGDFILFRSDGWPTYLFTVVVDDHDMGITQVIRGEEHLSNVPKQQVIYKALNWPVPEWVHIPMILDINRKKLSKRSGAVGIGDYRDKGWLPEALTGYLATLSWSKAPSDRLLSLEEMGALFDLKDIALASPVHDPSRLNYFGNLSLRSDRMRIRLSNSVAAKFPLSTTESIEAFIDEILPECAAVSDFEARLEMLCNPLDIFPFEGDIPLWYRDIIQIFMSIPKLGWTVETIKMSLRPLPSTYEIKAVQMYSPLREVLTGQKKGIPLPLICALLGQDETVRRLEKIIGGSN